MPDVVEHAPAKVNLFLRVVGRRADGYHQLESLAVFAGAMDQVRAAPAAALSLTINGPFAAGLDQQSDNLVLRAARALAAHGGRNAGAALVLGKHLPVASGIGGGSADAAATLRALAQLWGIAELPPGLALGLGADVPVCMPCLPAMMRGIGDVLSPAPGLPRFGLLLANPRVAVATPQVFRARAAAFSAQASLPAAWPDAAAMADACGALGNDLQQAAQSLCPAISEVLGCIAAVSGCLLSQMSGSGATCFGLFATPDEAARAAIGLADRGWWTWGGAPFGQG